MNQKETQKFSVPALTSASSLANYWFDTEKREQLLVRQFVRPGMTFFDVGAHIGRYTRLFSVAAGPRGGGVARRGGCSPSSRRRPRRPNWPAPSVKKKWRMWN